MLNNVYETQNEVIGSYILKVPEIERVHKSINFCVEVKWRQYSYLLAFMLLSIWLNSGNDPIIHYCPLQKHPIK